MTERGSEKSEAAAQQDPPPEHLNLVNIAKSEPPNCVSVIKSGMNENLPSFKIGTDTFSNLLGDCANANAFDSLASSDPALLERLKSSIYRRDTAEAYLKNLGDLLSGLKDKELETLSTKLMDNPDWKVKQDETGKPLELSYIFGRKFFDSKERPFGNTELHIAISQEEITASTRIHSSPSLALYLPGKSISVKRQPG